MQPPPGGYPPNPPPGSPPGQPPIYAPPPGLYGNPPGYTGGMQLQHPAGLPPHRGPMILVLGLVGLLMCVAVGVFAWLFGNKDLAEMDAGRMDPAGRDLTKAGKILGMVAVGLWVVGGFAVVGFLLLGALMAVGSVGH